MKHGLLLFLLATLPCVAQAQFAWPFGVGDRVVIGDCLLRFDDEISDIQGFDLDSAFAVKRLMRMYPSDLILFDPVYPVSYHAYNVGRTQTGIVAAEDGYFTELFPDVPPQTDTVWLMRRRIHTTAPPDQEIYRYCTGIREFDTTFAGETVQAFSAEIHELDGMLVYRYTVADGYGVIRIQLPDGSEQTLTRYKIGEKNAGTGPYTLDLPRICTDLRYEYEWEYQSPIAPYYEKRETSISIRDTTIHDTLYYLEIYELFPGLRVTGPVRYEGNQLLERLNDLEYPVNPPEVLLGDLIPRDSPYDSYWITEIDTIDYLGKRLACTYLLEPLGSVDTEYGSLRYYSGIGYWGRTTSNGMGDITETLTGYTPCVQGDAVPGIPSLPRWEVETYPSPATEYVTIAVTSAATAVPVSGTVQIFDVLGHTVLTYAWDSITQGSALTIPIPGFAPGVYFYRLTGNHAWLGEQFTVVRK